MGDEGETHIAIFHGNSVRKVWYAERWWFVVEDIVKILTDSDSPKEYVKKLRQRDEILDKGWGQVVHTLHIQTDGGKQSMNCSDTEGIFRIIQSIPSKKAEPFKRWLAKVGYERVKEIENPELAKERMKELFEKKGYSKEWIEKRLRGIAMRQELTDEWKNRGVKEELEFAILTNEISKATFGKTVEEYRKLKKLKTENLRDHMDDLELIFTMLGEAATTRIVKSKDVEGLEENKVAARQGGEVAGNARKELEQKTGESVVSEENYLGIQEKLKKKRKMTLEASNFT